MADNQLLNNNNDGDVGGDDDIFVYTGGEQRVPDDVRRLRIAENVDTIAAAICIECRQLIEVEGHKKIKKIKEYAFSDCPSLRSVMKMTGLVEVEEGAFYDCCALSELDFDKLEIIGYNAFTGCNSLRSINMPSIRRVRQYAFVRCPALTDAVFGKDLERIEGGAFDRSSLRRITIPLKVLIRYDSFSNSEKLTRVDTLAGGVHKTIASLHLESWRNEMQEEIDSINQTLPNTPAYEKTLAIHQWITRVLQRMEHLKAEHHILLKEATTLLELALWKANLRENEADASSAAQEGVRVTRGRVKRARKDRCITSGASIVIKNVLPFLALK